ncbi:MAG: copper-binding protein [Bradyrhizobium sp.]|nr:copper-binding protein [Bradyrhizobium sp.]
MKLTMIIAAVALFPLAGCGSKSEVPAATPTAQAMAMPDAPGAVQVGKIVHGVGEVTAIDAPGGKITLKHQAIAEAHWPAMTMAFTATPAIIAKAKVGEQATFDLKLGAAGGEITAITPR